MYIQSGEIKANKADIEAIKVFLEHARADMSYGADGSYSDMSLDNNLDEKTLKKGQLGLENIEVILKVLCPKW